MWLLRSGRQQLVRLILPGEGHWELGGPALALEGVLAASEVEVLLPGELGDPAEGHRLGGLEILARWLERALGVRHLSP